MDINEAVLRFLEYCELDKNLSLKTVRMYGYYLNFFKQWLLQSQKRQKFSGGKNRRKYSKKLPIVYFARVQKSL